MASLAKAPQDPMKVNGRIVGADEKEANEESCLNRPSYIVRLIGRRKHRFKQQALSLPETLFAESLSLTCGPKNRVR